MCTPVMRSIAQFYSGAYRVKIIWDKIRKRNLLDIWCYRNCTMYGRSATEIKKRPTIQRLTMYEVQ
jgi:hypothetical protein